MSTADMLSFSKYGYVEGFKGEKKGSQLFLSAIANLLIWYCDLIVWNTPYKYV